MMDFTKLESSHPKLPKKKVNKDGSDNSTSVNNIDIVATNGDISRTYIGQWCECSNEITAHSMSSGNTVVCMKCNSIHKFNGHVLTIKES